MLHIDLFSGIGGASLAVDTVWGKDKIKHIFCDNEPFAQRALRKHWRDSIIYGDIRTLTYTDLIGRIHGQSKEFATERDIKAQRESVASIEPPFLLTGGFPCQPFSQAGRRKGTEDDRYLWPEMLRIIRTFRPRWIIGENVAGLLSMVQHEGNPELENKTYSSFEEARADCEEVRRISERSGGWGEDRRKVLECESAKAQVAGSDSESGDDSHGECKGLEWRNEEATGYSGLISGEWGDQESDWRKNWLEVATELCGMDDGLPAKLDGFELTKSQHRKARLKGLGNAWVPQVAIEIMRAISIVDPIR